MEDESFNKKALVTEGFTGWTSFAQIRTESSSVPLSGGVYVVMRPSSEAPLI